MPSKPTAAVAFVAVLLVAGCTAPTASQQPTDAARWFGRGDIASFAATDLADLANGAEPGIQAAPDGRLWVLAWTGLFTRLNGPWTQVATPFDHGGDSDFAVGGDGSLYVLGMQLSGQGAPYLPYWRSTDLGKTWTLVADLHPEGPIDRPWIAAAPDGRLVAVWNDFEDKRAAIATSADGGDNWSVETYIDDAWYPYVTRPVFRGSETFVAMFGTATVVAHQRSPGTTWRALPGPDAAFAPFFTPLAVDGAGRLHHVAIEQDGEVLRAVHRSSQDGSTWSNPAVVSTGPQAVMPWPIALHDGVAVAFYHATQAVDDRPLPLQLLMPQPDGLAWHAVVAFPEGSSWRLVNTTVEPIHRGPMCTRFSQCSEGAAPFFDAFEAVATPEGDVAVVHVVHGDQRGGAHGLVVAVG